ncbi:hypothetical protein [Amycolatopsis sp. NPDC052450]|uniref:hypothetical protein n=1 Tax=Amycolatopsis sp. NPDC052450 TaxID=3363937 RepID=UPI0037C5B43F
MRPTIVLLAGSDSRRELERRLRRAGSYTEGDVFDHLDVGECRFGIDLSNRVLSDYAEPELKELVDRLGEFDSILVEYSDVSCLRPLLKSVLAGLTGFIDTNFGELIDYVDVLERFDREPSWDWSVPQPG